MSEWKYTSEELNQKIRTLDKVEPPIWEVPIPSEWGTGGCGKAIFYWGWFWIDVDFDNYPYTMAVGKDGYVGFCENNKWGYTHLLITKEHSKELRRLIKDAISSLENDPALIMRGKFKEVWAYMQDLK